MSTPIDQRKVLLAGATGLVGGVMLQALLADPTVAQVHALSRRPLRVRHPRLQVHIVNFSRLPALPQADEVYLAPGTTIKVAGSQAAFRAVDLEANLAVTKAAFAAEPVAQVWSVRLAQTRSPPRSTAASRVNWRTPSGRWG
ncbi:hypothetical protein HpMS107_49110 [Helicobacter pylori]|uniref:hypothetical protein n=1 Tax=Cupriavidus TaxID=106589 RepID=UPI0004B39C7E